MTSLLTTPKARETTWKTVADLIHALGDIPPERIRWQPVPGTATEADLIAANEKKAGIYELVDGTLVRKAMGIQESSLAVVLIRYLAAFVLDNKLGMVFASDAMFRTVGTQHRAPDVAFVRREQFPTGQVERTWIAQTGVDLAVEILSISNTAAEIRRQLEEYFASGTALAWVADPATRMVRVHTSADEFTELTAADTLTGGDVLPGFELSIQQWFEQGTSV